jgi:hypothetical protein
MNGTLIITLLATGMLAAAGLAILVLVVSAIHREERHTSLATGPSTRADILTRRILGARISQPEARRVLAERLACSPPPTARRPRPAPAPARPPQSGDIAPRQATYPG